MFHELYAHLAWTTRDRLPLIDFEGARFLTRILRALARKEHAYVLEIGLVSTIGESCGAGTGSSVSAGPAPTPSH
jgi:hypothetical protein